MGDKLEQLSGGTFGCFDDTGICIDVYCCCGGSIYHWTDSAARYQLMIRQENVNLATRCCGLCGLCYITEVEERLNEKLGGSRDYYRKCCCYMCLGACRVCHFLRALKAIEEQGLLKVGGAPQSEEMEK